MRKILVSLIYFISGLAIAGSTINPTIPLTNSSLSSAPLRANFTSAYNDINNLLTQFSAATAPPSPSRYQYWLNTTSNPYVLNVYDGANWVSVGKLDTTAHTWSPTGTYSGSIITPALGGTGQNMSASNGALSVTSGVMTASKLSAAYLADSLSFSGKTVTGGTFASPVLTNPGLGVATATTINNLTITQPATNAVLTIANNKTFQVNNSITLAGTDGITLTTPSTSFSAARTDAAQTFTGIQTFASTISGSITGNAATVTTNANLTGDVTSSGNATTLAAGSAANLNSGTLLAARMPALTGDITTSAGAVATTLASVATAGTTGSSIAIPVITIDAKGRTTSITTAALIAPASTLTGTTLASNITASSLTSFGASPALGTPASGVATNLTGTAAGLTAGTVTTNANLTGPVTSSGNATSIASAIGIGTTASAWGTNYKAIEGGGASGFSISSSNVNPLQLFGNAYETNSNDIYTTTGVASRYEVGNSGFHRWSHAVSGSAGNTITWVVDMQLGATGTFSLPNLAASSAPTTGTLCWTSGGNINVDTTVACLSSTIKVKQKILPLDSGLAAVLKMHPVSYELKPEFNPEKLGRQVGLIAEEVQKIDNRLIAVDDKGEPRGVRYMQMTAVLIKAIQEQQEEISELKKQVEILNHKH